MDVSSTPPEENRFALGLPTNADTQTKIDFARSCVALYKSKGWRGSTLSEYFGTNFSTYSVEDFAAIDDTHRRRIRDLLRDKGVYVAKGRNVNIAGALYQTAQAEQPWPENEMQFAARGKASTLEMDSSAPSQRTACQVSDRTNIVAKKGFNSNLGNMFKAYNSDNDRYDGSLFDNFDRKFALYIERCEQNQLDDETCRRGFSIMLHGPAHQHYFDKLRNKELTVQELCTEIRKRFNTEERVRALLREWEAASLKETISKNPHNTATNNLEKLVCRLQDIQASLPLEYQNDSIFRNRLLNAVRDVDECRLAYHKPAGTVHGVISDLHSSLSTESKLVSVLPATPAAHITDRRYHSSEHQKHAYKDKKCFACGKPGCWSTKHSPKERIQAFKKNRQIRQFVTNLSTNDQNSSSDSEIADAMEEIVIHMQDIWSHTNVETEENTQSCDSNSSAQSSSAFISHILHFATVHAVSECLPRLVGPQKFKGIMFDTGAAHASSGNIEQYLAYCTMTGTIPTIDSKEKALVRFGIGEELSKGMAKISFPVDDLWLSFEMHVVNADVPILICIDDMDRIGVYFNYLTNRLHHPESGRSVPLKRVSGHSFFCWSPVSQCHFTTVELQRLHRRFGHPAAEKLANVLSRSGLDKTPVKTRKMLIAIEKHCRSCQTYAQAPRRFKFRLKDDVDFNHMVYVDIFYIDNQPVLHVVDEATHYRAARWLPTVSADAIWRALRLCWIDSYLGPPDIVKHDAEKNFMARTFQKNSATIDIQLKSVLVESPQSMSTVERYHTPVRRAYNVIRSECQSLDQEATLQMAVKAVNDSVGPNGLIPTLLVYGALPRLGFATDPPTPSLYERARAYKKATKEISEYFARSKIKTALHSRNGPNVLDIHNVPIGGHVLVYRPKIDKWDGPYTLLHKDSEDFTILMDHGLSKFRSTSLKPFCTPLQGPSTPHSGDTETAHSTVVHFSLNLLNHDSGSPEIRFSQISNNHNRFESSQQSEFSQLLDRGVFDIVPMSEAKGFRLYGARFLDQVKNEGLPGAFEKLRLVIQGFSDKSHKLLTYDPTVLRSSQRVLLCFAAMFKSLRVFTRDVRQAYTQSKTELARTIFIHPPKSLNIPSEHVLRVVRPLYGLPESGVHWFKTYHDHHTTQMHMIPSIHDTCFLFTPKSLASSNPESASPTQARGLTCLQTDDTLNVGNESFLQLEARMAQRFSHKPRLFITGSTPVLFNGAKISNTNQGYFLMQNEHIVRLQKVTEQSSLSDYVTIRARGAYVASVSRPDLSFGFAVRSQYNRITPQSVKLLNDTVELALRSPNRGLRFCSLDPESCYIAVFSDASFASNPDHSSQLGYVICMADKYGMANILLYSSVKSRRIARSALAAELFALVHAFDQASTMRLSFNTILDRNLHLALYTDCQSLYESLVRVNGTAEKRLLIDLALLRKSYERREIAEVTWIPLHQNPADALAKANPTNALNVLIDENKVHIIPYRWVDRPPSSHK